MQANAKYLKDENDEIFSPIVSTETIYNNEGTKLTDLLGDKNSELKTFYWDGKSSDENPNNIEFFQNIIDLAIAGENVAIYSFTYEGNNNQSVADTFFAIISKELINQDLKYDNGWIEIWNLNDYESLRYVSEGYSTVNCTSSVFMTYVKNSEEKITISSVDAIERSRTNNKCYLPTDGNYEYVIKFEPTFPHHPATKKYVDDKITVGEESQLTSTDKPKVLIQSVPNLAIPILNKTFDENNVESDVAYADMTEYIEVKAGDKLHINFLFKPGITHSGGYGGNKYVLTDTNMNLLDSYSNGITMSGTNVELMPSWVVGVQQDGYFRMTTNNDLTLYITKENNNIIKVLNENTNNYESNYFSNKFTTDETVVGVTDTGRKIYRRTYFIGNVITTASGSKDNYINYTIPNLDMMIDMKGGFQMNSRKTFVPWNFYNHDMKSGTGIYYAENKINYFSGFGGTNGFVTMDYLKTTD